MTTTTGMSAIELMPRGKSVWASVLDPTVPGVRKPLPISANQQDPGRECAEVHALLQLDRLHSARDGSI